MLFRPYYRPNVSTHGNTVPILSPADKGNPISVTQIGPMVYQNAIYKNYLLLTRRLLRSALRGPTLLKMAIELGKILYLYISLS